MKNVQKQLHKPSRFLHKIYTLCVKIFHKLSMIMKTSMMVIKPKALHIPWLMLLFHRPAQPSYRRLCSGLSYAYYRVNLMPLILKQGLLPVYYFTIKQAGLVVIKRKAFRNHILFCALAALFLHFFVHLSLSIHPCP